MRTFWDSEASVWVVASSDVPGLATEAPALDALKAKLDVLIPELLAANGVAVQPSVPVELVAQLPPQLELIADC